MHVKGIQLDPVELYMVMSENYYVHGITPISTKKMHNIDFCIMKPFYLAASQSKKKNQIKML